MRTRILLGLLVVVFLGASSLFLWRLDPVLGPLYDALTGQHPIQTPGEVARTIAAFPAIRFEKLRRTRYARAADLDYAILPGLYEGKTFLRVDGFSRYRYVVRRFRIKDFLPRRIITGSPWRDYLVLDEHMLGKFLQFAQAMERINLDPDQMKVTSGFRTPAQNTLMATARRSRHLYGDAVDVWVGDVNRDGRINSADFNPVYRILDEVVIADQGGLGTYRSEPNVLHFDTRGTRARWRY